MSDEDDVILPKPLPFVGQIFGRGKCTGPPAESEADHFYKCGECNGWVDKRNLAPRFADRPQGRAPNKPDSAARWPRLLSREAAAEYCSVSVNHFTEHFPGEATRIGKRKLYDIRLLDRWVDSLNGGVEDDDEEWLRRLNDNPPKERASGRG